MKKYVISAKTCQSPVVDMETGHVIAHSFVPYFSKDNLSLDFLALLADDGTAETAYIPFASIGFVNDACTMVNTPHPSFTPNKDTCCKLIGAPLTAKAGTISLFSFGSIARTEISENGEVTLLALGDGHSFLIPRENTPENAVINDVFASEAFNCTNNTLRVSLSSAAAAHPVENDLKPVKTTADGVSVRIEDPLEKFGNSFADTTESAPTDELQSVEELLASTTPEAEPAIPSDKTVPDAIDIALDYIAPATPAAPVVLDAAADVDLSAISPAPVISDTSSDLTASAVPAASPAPAENDPTVPAVSATPDIRPLIRPESRRKKRSRFRRCVAPIVAMLVFFFLYFVMSTFFIQGTVSL